MMKDRPVMRCETPERSRPHPKSRGNYITLVAAE
jgi:hypothetical protein